MADFDLDVIHLVRFATEGRTAEVAALSRRILRAVGGRRPDLADSVTQALQSVAATPARGGTQVALPVDLDSRLELVRREAHPALPIEPVWPPNVQRELDAFLAERTHEERLADAGMAPTPTMLFIGPPGVGKTMAARWLAARLGRTLLTLDLAAVMSSFLGRTGSNIRLVLDFARSTPSVLLLDEFDAIAKRRDDSTEVGELKRLVTVLLQAVDDWPSSGVLIAATNHPELLDPAVWRRFDRVVEFPKPSPSAVRQVLERVLGDEPEVAAQLNVLASLLDGRSFDDVARLATSIKRSAIVDGLPLSAALTNAVGETAAGSSLATKLEVAKQLARAGRSRRKIAALTGISRATLLKYEGPAQPERARRARG